MTISRRRFLVGAGAAGAGLAFAQLFERRALAIGFGSLVRDPNGILDLPAGFSYRVLQRRGDPMSDGHMVPGAPDGMACFAGPDQTLILMRNHEVGYNDPANGPWGGRAPSSYAYDRSAYGGVTRVVLDETTLEVRSSNLVLAGTVRNCGGGASPWGWLSCEEDTSTGHGYVFVCPSDAATIQPPQRVIGFGRMNHEAACVDTRGNVTYLSEDRDDSCLYRFVPADPAAPFVGTLQAMRVIGQPGIDLGVNRSVGSNWSIDWVNLPQPDSSSDSLRLEARSKGAAKIRRGEGLFYAGGQVYLCSTSGGGAAAGQIFRVDPAIGRITLIGQSTSKSKLDMPDNICVAPWGDLYMAEDGSGTQYVRILEPGGAIRTFARNALSSGEFAGVTFSPDGSVLFLNMQKDHLTLAVTGPFPIP